MEFHWKTIIATFMLSFIFFSSCTDRPKPLNRSKKRQDTIKSNIKTESKKLHKESDYKKLKESIKKLEYKKALKLIQSLRKSYPKNPEILYLLAVITKNSNPDPLKAIEILHFVTSIDEHYGKAWKLLGDLYYIRGELKSAIKSWELAQETIKNSAELYYKLAYVYYTAHDNKLAVKYFQKSLEINKKLEWSYYYLAEIHFEKLKKPKLAIDFLKRGIKELPKSKNLNQKLAILYYNSGKYKEAIIWNKEVLKIIKYDNFAIENISNAYMKLKNYDKAIEWLDKIVKEQPKSIYYIKKLANLYKSNNKLEKTIELLSFAFNLKEDFELKNQIAKLYLILGNTKKYEEIVKELKKSKNPNAMRISEYLKMEEKK